MNSIFNDPGFWHRLQFGFTIIYHYLFPQLTMGLAWFIVYWKWRALRTGDEKYNQAVRFWAKIFGLNFAVGVVTGIPMEFQFGTNWADFSKYAGGVIGQTLAMEGMFAFFFESAFIGALIWGEKRLGKRAHFLTTISITTDRGSSWNARSTLMLPLVIQLQSVSTWRAPVSSQRSCLVVRKSE